MAESKRVGRSGGVVAALRGPLGLKLAALTMILILVAIVTVALVMFSGGFTPSVSVTLSAPRSGLVLDPDAKVKVRGVKIGTVTEVDRSDKNAKLELALDPELLKMVPENATVDIRSTTVFGAKYVNFMIPPEPSSESMAPGAELAASKVTVEFNTVFQHLSDVLAQVEPEKLNATLNALGTALQGRGEKLGDLLSRSDAYLRDINPSLPTLRRDLVATADVGNLYGDTADDLLRTVDNARVTSRTLTEQESDFDGLLANVTGLADTTGSVLRDNEQQFSTALDLLRPTTGLLDQYRPGLSCLVNGVANALPLAEQMVGGGQEGIALNASFMYGPDPYQYPKDLPKVNATGGPQCDNLVDRTPGSHSDYVVTDTSQGEPYAPSTEMKFNAPKVFQTLFAGLPGVGQP